MIALAVDLGGSHATCAVVKDRSILASSTLPANGRAGLGSLLPELAHELNGLFHSAGVSAADCDGLVFSFCGIVDARERRILSTNGKFEDAAGIDLVEWSSALFGLPFAIENDARMALLGEHACGAAQGVSDAVMLTLGSGIGGAAIIDGRLLYSRHGQAGTLGGHIPVVLQGRQCTCGNLGCAEAEASTAFLAEIYQAQQGSSDGSLAGRAPLDFATLFAALDGGDLVAKRTLDRCIQVWSALSVALIHVYDPEVLVFGGSVMKRAADILPRVQAYVDNHAWTPWGNVEVRRGSLGNLAAIHGAIPLLEAIR